MDWIELLFREIQLSFLWVALVFLPLTTLIAKKKDVTVFCIMFIIRAVILLCACFMTTHYDNILLMDILLLAVFSVMIGLFSLMVKNNNPYKINTKSYQDKTKEEIKPKAISKDENKVRVIRSKVISNQKEYLKDNYNLGGSEHNKENSYGNNNDGDYSNRVTLSNHSNEGVYISREMNSTIQELCTYCGEEVKSDFIYCPSCGKPIVSKMIQDTDGFN